MGFGAPARRRSGRMGRGRVRGMEDALREGGESEMERR
jgi:hypothetical protein